MKGVSCQKELEPFVGRIVLFCANNHFSRLLENATYRIKNKNWLELEAAFIDVTRYGTCNDRDPWCITGGYPIRRLLNNDAIEKEAYLSNGEMFGSTANLLMREPTHAELKQIVDALDTKKAKLEFMETCKDAFQKALQLPSSEVLSTRLCNLEDENLANAPTWGYSPFRKAIFDVIDQTDLIKQLENQKWSEVESLIDSAINKLRISNRKSAHRIKRHKMYIIDAVLSAHSEVQILQRNRLY
jgi:hypothetical protein